MEIKLNIKGKSLTLKQKVEILQKVEEIKQIAEKSPTNKPKRRIPVTLDEFLESNI